MATINFPELCVDSSIENFAAVKNWLQKIFDDIGCIGKASKQIFIAVDEIYTNISNYAYEDIGKIQLDCSYNSEDALLKICLTDYGFAYNPLKRPDPDIPQRIKEKTIGGLGIFMAKKSMDSIEYSRVDNKNVLVLLKKIN